MTTPLVIRHHALVPDVEVIGVHPIEADEPCHLVEVVIRESTGDVSFDEFTQADDSSSRSDWQVAYDERVLSPDGSTLRPREPAFVAPCRRSPGTDAEAPIPTLGAPLVEGARRSDHSVGNCDRYRCASASMRSTPRVTTPSSMRRTIT